MTRRLITIRLDPALVNQVDAYARDHHTTRTGLLEEMCHALLEGRLAVVPRGPGDYGVLPSDPMPGSSPMYPVLVCLSPEGA